MTGTALITGATGFIGGALTRRLLADGWTAHAILRPDSVLDIEHPALTAHRLNSAAEIAPVVNETRPDCVFHLASLFLAEHQPSQINALVESNVTFGVHLAEAAASAGVAAFINTGTAWQHFEQRPYEPTNLYAATKQAFEDILRYYHSAHGLPCVTLRLYDTYGVGDKRRKLMQILIDTAQSGAVIEMSPGDQIVDLSHVDDIVSAFLLAAQRTRESQTPLWESFLLSGERYSVKALVEVVAQALDKPIAASFGGRPYRAREVMEPIAATEQLPGWTRQTDIRSYLRQTGD
ncbi:MAG: NAD(P)-dependent oxidoreductase [Brevundimonas sp.]|nr:MAG: NAD(P)-dependent oxidoreductase [Brevundimonas sp.]